MVHGSEDISNINLIFRLAEKSFVQLVDQPTHIEGNLLDHLYIRHAKTDNVLLHHPYYSDHDSVMAIVDLKQNLQ